MTTRTIGHIAKYIAIAALALGGCKKDSELGPEKALGSIAVSAPKSWKETPVTRKMRRAQWNVGNEDKAAELIVYYFGKGGAGGLQANLDRWFGQFQQPDGKQTKDVAKVDNKTIADMKVTRVEVGGRYVAAVAPGSNQKHDKPNARMLAAIVEAPDGAYYFKMVGPEATVKGATAGFDAMLGSLKATGKVAEGAAKHPDPKPEKAEPTPAERMAKVRQRHVDAHKKELARWTDDMRKQVTELAGKGHKDAKAALTAILASPHRVPDNAKRDQYRHPLETLALFGVKQDMTVIEAGSGAGWYSEILAPLLAKKGKLVVASFDPAGPNDSFRTILGLRVKDYLSKSAELYGKASTVIVNPPDKIELGPDSSADMVLAFREMHNWQRNDFLDKYVASIHKVLKPGGVFGVVQHRAKPGQDGAVTAKKGRLPQDWLVKKVEAAGFKLAEASEVNKNEKDTADYKEGVWTLPPSLALKDQDKEKYQAIGESDRMTLKFVKKK